jgi:two-component system CheB/CheR fusion protein
MQQTPAEVDALFKNLMIGVTNFFRDPQAFEFLETRVFLEIFEGKLMGGTVRIWCTGCSTGEEAYSIAILLVERVEAFKQSYLTGDSFASRFALCR